MQKKIQFPYFSITKNTLKAIFQAAIVIAVVVALWHSEVYAQNDQYLKKEFTGADGSVLPYRILYPEDLQQGVQYPVVLFLHGAGERGNDNEKQLVHGSGLFLDDSNRKAYPAIVIFPQCPENEWWVDLSVIGNIRMGNNTIPANDYPASAPLKLVKELMVEILSKEIVDNDRVYVMGLSMGAFGIFDLLHRRPDWFAAAVPICGGGDTSKVHKYAGKLPLWVFHGSDDSVVPAEASRMMVNALQEAGGDIIYTEYPGVDHNSWDPAFAEKDLLPWIFENKRKR
ncbi:MAG: phospholipase [Bacteroidetes bacterium]|nr:MAG: phospholipase [Bacteroidota bacterium]